MACHSNVTESARDPAACGPANLADVVNVANLKKVVGTSAKLELRLVDTQRLDAMVKRGWWNAKLRSGPRTPGDTAPGCDERRFNELPLASRLALRQRG